jgi:hypothetical protein
MVEHREKIRRLFRNPTRARNEGADFPRRHVSQPKRGGKTGFGGFLDSSRLPDGGASAVWKRSHRSQIELNSHHVGVVEPYEFLLPVSVFFDPAIGNSRAT